MKDVYFLLDAVTHLPYRVGDYHEILDAILYYNLNLGDYRIAGCEIPLEEIHADVESLRVDLADRFAV